MPHLSRPFLPFVFISALLVGLASASHGGEPAFTLVKEGKVLPVFVDPGSGAPVVRAAMDLANDIARVSKADVSAVQEGAPSQGECIIIGRLGAGGLIDTLAASGRLDTQGIKGTWEAGVRAVVAKPAPGISRALVIAGSDMRGAIFTLYGVSESIGVSPWYWWADVPLAANPRPSVSTAVLKVPSPSVQYRGIFINDEDWGLQPWAEKTFEPESGGIGPKTNARVCELLLRLGANTLWPAMHACTPAFNSNPENRLVAARYGIVMGSSHAEPMLRNNVREWSVDPKLYDYTVNRDGVVKYWEQRVVENGRYENIYTIGMRGIHDSAMQGAKSTAEQKDLLEKIFADQRALIAKHISPDPSRVPQIFCAYKEVLEAYRKGLKVPGDVTIVWPDDNFGYVRSFASDEERRRSGGCGIYYHISYLGSPLSYLWLNTTPPALIWSEMFKAYEMGARKLWIVNVGDIKPAEIGMEFFLQMARDIKRWDAGNLPDFLKTWAAREFGPENADAIARVMAEYYRLNFQRKPEHLQWWMPNQPRISSPLTTEETRERLQAFADLQFSAEQIASRLPASHADAFFELVLYPVRGAAAANERYFCLEMYHRLKDSDADQARGFAARALAANAVLLRETAYYNERLAGGKWKHLISLEPADQQWARMRLAPAVLPEGDFGTAPVLTGHELPAKVSKTQLAPRFAELDGVISIEAGHFSAKSAPGQSTWEIIPGLGRTSAAVSVFPITAEPPAENELRDKSPRLEYTLRFAADGDYTLRLQVLPTHPIRTGQAQRVGYSLDDATPSIASLPPQDATAIWSQGVLNAYRQIDVKLHISTAGSHQLRLYGIDPGLSVDKLIIYKGDKAPASFLGPKETLDPIQ
jgi:hypothetical protein